MVMEATSGEGRVQGCQPLDVRVKVECRAVVDGAALEGADGCPGWPLETRRRS